jgi:hypothetical protein
MMGMDAEKVLRELFKGVSSEDVIRVIKEAAEAGEETQVIGPGSQYTRFPGRYEELGQEIGELVDKKNAAYGDSFRKSGNILREMYPQGIKPEQYDDVLAMIRIIDKMFRIATNKDAFGENPWQDIAGYGILKAIAPGAEAHKGV